MRWLGLTAFFVPFSFALGALADVPPGDVCGEVGTACQHAEPDFKSPGTCTKSTCSKRDLSTGKDYTYECLRCIPTSKPPPTPTTPSSTTPTPTPPADKASGGCRVSPAAGGSADFLSLAAALALLGLRRRR